MRLINWAGGDFLAARQGGGVVAALRCTCCSLGIPSFATTLACIHRDGRNIQTEAPAAYRKRRSTSPFRTRRPASYWCLFPQGTYYRQAHNRDPIGPFSLIGRKYAGDRRVKVNRNWTAIVRDVGQRIFDGQESTFVPNVHQARDGFSAIHEIKPKLRIDRTAMIFVSVTPLTTTHARSLLMSDSALILAAFAAFLVALKDASMSLVCFR